MRAFKFILRALLVIVGIGLALLAIYAGWRLIRSHWAALLFFAFIAAGIIFAAAGAIMLSRAQHGLGRDALLLTLPDLLPQSRLAKVRQAAGKFLGVLIAAAGGWVGPLWRATFKRRGYGNESSVQFAMRSSFEGNVADFAPSALPLVLIAYLVAFLAPGQIFWVKAFLGVLGLQTIFRHLNYAVNLTSLPTILRRSPRQPYTSFLIVAVSDLASLILIFNSILNWSGGHLVVPPELLGVLKRLYFSDLWSVVKSVWNGKEPPLVDILITGAGVLYNSILLKTLLQVKDFQRTDEDYVSLASGYCGVGRYIEALATLEKIKQQTITTYSVRASAYIGVSQFDKATEECKRILALRGIDATPEHILNTLLSAALWLPLAPGAYLGLVRLSIETGSDVELANVLNMFVQNGMNVANALALFANGNDQKLPLSYCTLLIANNQITEAQQWLNSVQINAVSGKIFHAYLVLTAATLANPNSTAQQDKDFFDNWSQQLLPQVSTWVSSQTLRGLDLLSIFAPILTIQLIARRFQSHYEQSWLFVLEQLKKTIAADKIAQEGIGMITGLEKRARAQTT